MTFYALWYPRMKKEQKGHKGHKGQKKSIFLAVVLNYIYLRVKLHYMHSSNIITLNSDYKKLLCYQKRVVIYDLTYHCCSRFVSRADETIANMAIVLIRQAMSLVRNYVNRVSGNFAEEGGFREQMTKVRLMSR